MGNSNSQLLSSVTSRSADSEDTSNAIKNLFKAFDKNRSGFLETSEAEDFFKAARSHLAGKADGSQTALFETWKAYFDLDRDRKISYGEFRTKVYEFLRNTSQIQITPPKQVPVLILYSIEAADLFNTSHAPRDEYADPRVRIHHRAIEYTTMPLMDKKHAYWYPNICLPVHEHEDIESFTFFIEDHLPSPLQIAESTIMKHPGLAFTNPKLGKNRLIGKFTINSEQLAKEIEKAKPDGTDKVLTFADTLTLEPEVIARANEKAKTPTYVVTFQYQIREQPLVYTPKNYKMQPFNFAFYTAAIQSYPEDVKGEQVKEPHGPIKRPRIENYTDKIKIAIEDSTEPVQSIDEMTKFGARVLRKVRWIEEKENWTREQGCETIGLLMGHYLPHAPEGEWTQNNLTSDIVLTRFFFQGLAATRLKRNADKKGFYADFDSLKDFPVRKGLVPYQGKIYFDDNGLVDRIEYGGKVSKPGNSDWEYAKFLIRSTACAIVTVHEHLVDCHQIWSNIVSTANVSNLSADHPVRRLLHIHTYRAMYINEASYSLLIPKGGGLEHMAAFKFDTLQNVLDALNGAFKYQTWSTFLKSQNMDDVDPKLYPVAQDGTDYWNYVNAWVIEYLEEFYRDKGEDIHLPTQDKELVAFWKEIQGRINGLPDLNMDSLREVLTQYIFVCSGYHNQVGNVVATVRDPAFACNTIFEGSTLAWPQAFFIQVATAMGTCGKMPTMLDDYSHLFLTAKAKAAFNKMRENGRKLKEVITERNKERRWPYCNFDPEHCETSVAV